MKVWLHPSASRLQCSYAAWSWVSVVMPVPSQCGPECCCQQWPAGKAVRGHWGLFFGSRVWPCLEWLYRGSCSGLHPSLHCSYSGSDWSAGPQRIWRTGAILCEEKKNAVKIKEIKMQRLGKDTSWFSNQVALKSLNPLAHSISMGDRGVLLAR